MKKCRRCGEVKPFLEFFRNRSKPDGLSGECRECQKAYLRGYTKSDDQLTKTNERVKKYFATDKGKATAIRSTKRKRELYPVKSTARSLLQSAVKNGQIVKQPCEVCDNLVVEAHHDDYTKPLSVRWLCKKHHDEWHRNNEPKYE